MAIRNLTIELQIDDTDLDRDIPFNIWLFQFLNRLGYIHKIKSFTLDNSKKTIAKNDDLKVLPLKEGKDLN